MEVSNQIIAVMDDLAQRFGIIFDWTSQNIMPYLQELSEKFIKYKAMVSFMWIIASLVIVLCFVRLIKSKTAEFWEICDVIIGILTISSIVIVYNISILIKLYAIPELYLFEYIQNMIK